MPSPTRTLTARTARSLIDDSSWAQTSGRRVGIEIEWFTTPSSSPPDVATLRALLEPASPLPGGSSLTFEPGGQVELSSLPFDWCGEACVAVGADRKALEDALRPHGIGLTAAGIDSDRPEALVTTEDRYVAMKTYFDHQGSAGRRMMCTSAAIHTNIDAGRDDVGRRRWDLAHRLGPVLVAAFADSPVAAGRPTGWKSSRMAAWLAIDPTRTAAVADGVDPVAAWGSYALNANVMFIRSPNEYVPLRRPFSFAQWIDEGHELGYPTADDLTYHLTTLFPPVRPHGWLELRMMDMVPDPWWRVAAAVTMALLYDEDASAAAEAATKQAAGMWREAARSALANPILREAARACFAAALEALPSVGCDKSTVEAVGEYADRFVAAGRCPADERLDAFRKEPATQVAEAI
jgi:glutamate--cysteine ligase